MAGWLTGCKVDTVAFTSIGVYSKYYGAGEEGNIANLFASLGLMEDAPDQAPPSPEIGGFFNFGFGLTLD